MEKTKSSWRMLLYPLLLALAITTLDQWSKAQILNAFSTPRGIISVTPFFNLVFVLNRGVSFGMFDNMAAMVSDVFALLAMGVASTLIIWLAYLRQPLNAAAFGLLIGGALGNAVDRLHLGAVVDFLDFHISHAHWPAFNVADSAVVTGVGLLLLQSLVFDKKNRHSS